jgi:DNA-binding NarL/FixJ family response regulator
MITVLIADGQELTSAGLASLIAGRDDLSILDIIHNADKLSELLVQHQPDVLTIDYNIPGSFTIADVATVNEFSPRTQVLVISSDNDRENILKVLQGGVKGYITKESNREEIMLAIRSTSRGEKFYCHKVLDMLMEQHLTKPENDQPTVLTSRETEILGHIARGNSTQQIADMLHLSAHTIHTHRKNIIRKLNIKSPTQFVIYAMDLGIIKPNDRFSKVS